MFLAGSVGIVLLFAFCDFVEVVAYALVGYWEREGDRDVFIAE